MSRNGSKLRLLPLLLAGGLLAGFIAPAGAGSSPDLIYADSFGNLIVESAAGYKRIIVGQGHRVRQLAQYMRSNERRHTIYPDDTVAQDDCWRPPVLVKGRSYMYGFDQGVIPMQGGPCR